MATQKTETAGVQLGRVLERLDQQDRNTVREATAIATSLKEHTSEDKVCFGEINVKLDTIIASQNRQKGAISMAALIATTIASVVAWVVTTFFR